MDSNHGIRWLGVPWRQVWKTRARITRGMHEILIVALCDMLCGAEDCFDMALFGRAKEGLLRQFLRLRHGIPSHDTFSRVFHLLGCDDVASSSRSSGGEAPEPYRSALLPHQRVSSIGAESVSAAVVMSI
jgi:hypothetical protein